MKNENHFIAANLSPNLVSEIKSFEETLSEQSRKKVVVIAYEREENQQE